MQFARQAKTGYAVPGVQLRVVDNHDKDVKPDGKQIGEIIVHSNVVMDGYYKDPEATKSAIRDGWFHTGDMAVMDEEGYVLIVDRSKDIIISGGENISSVEIENCLYANPKVFECAVVAVPDEHWGEVPKAIIVLKPGQSATEKKFSRTAKRTWLDSRCPSPSSFVTHCPKAGRARSSKRTCATSSGRAWKSACIKFRLPKSWRLRKSSFQVAPRTSAPISRFKRATIFSRTLVASASESVRSVAWNVSAYANDFLPFAI
jgi:acyl-CoA synthetase (AMP-forming)/AMP-acid ligase II